MNGCQNSKWYAIIIYLMCSFLLFPAILKVASASNENEGSTLIQQAEEAVSIAFQAVLKAENTGANVTNLIIRLNEAASDLSDAKVLLINGSSGDITKLVEHLVGITAQVKNEAQVLQANTQLNHDYIMKITIIELLVSVVVFLLIMAFIWSRFKSYYLQKF